jgi:prolyl-tRNA synthetase
MRAESGPIGGDMSHEFIILADTGESEVYCHRDLATLEPPGADLDYDSDLTPIIQSWTGKYAATSE